MNDKLLEKLGITPGPWYLSAYGDGTILGVCSGPAKYSYTIANFDIKRRQYVKDNDDENARFIAAAPDMLKLLIEGIILYEAHFEDSHYNCLLARQKAVVEKATGITWDKIKDLLDG